MIAPAGDAARSPGGAPAYAAVDLGATSGRVLIGHLAGGRLVTDEVARFPNTPVRVPRAGGARLTWDVLALWSGVLDGLARTRTPLTSVGIDTWGVDHGLLDADGALLGNPAHYRDARTDGMPDRFFAVMDAEQHYRLTGVQLQSFNSMFQLLAGADEVQTAAATRMLLMPDLLAWWLTGQQVAEVTNASTTGLLDVRARTWSPPVLSALDRQAGRPLSALLPGLIEPGTPVGPVDADLGLDGARVVAVGSHDTASAVAAVPMADPEHSAYISSGTWSLVGVELTEPVLTDGSRAANVTNELGVDGTVRYLKNVAGLWLLTQSQQVWQAAGRRHELPRLLAAAADVPACRTVIDVDDPTLAPPGDMPARIAELARRTGQPVPQDEATVTRCILDSLALAYRRAVREVGELSGRDLRVVHVVGGGSQNTLLCRLTAAATGLPVVAGPVEGTAMGNLLVQAWADGELSGGLPAIREVVAASTELTRWEPPADTRAWDQAETRLRDTVAARH